MQSKIWEALNGVLLVKPGIEKLGRVHFVGVLFIEIDKKTQATSKNV